MAANTETSRLDTIATAQLNALLSLDATELANLEKLAEKKTALLALADKKTALVALAGKSEELLALLDDNSSANTEET